MFPGFVFSGGGGGYYGGGLGINTGAGGGSNYYQPFPYFDSHPQQQQLYCSDAGANAGNGSVTIYELSSLSSVSVTNLFQCDGKLVVNCSTELLMLQQLYFVRIQ